MLQDYNHTEFVKKHFDINAQNWYDLYHKIRKANDIILTERKDISEALLCKYIRPPSKILDAGCGAGRVALDIVQKGFFVHGIDISPKMIDLCFQTFSENKIDKSNYLFSLGSFSGHDFPTDSFDAIIALGFLEYQENDVEILKSFHNIIRPGGILICSGPIKTRISNYFGLVPFLYWLIAIKLLKKVDTPVGINKYSLSRFKMLMESNDFNLIDYKRHGYTDIYFLNKLIGLKGQILIHNFLTKLSTFLPIDRFANDIVVVARRRN